MAKERKITCDCGGILSVQKTRFEDVETEAMVCNKCAFTTLTKEQAQQFVRLKQMHQIMDSERKIIKIGNSMGLTLPDRLQEFGAHVGKKVKTSALGPNSFKVEILTKP
jgi:hypothetical protein